MTPLDPADEKFVTERKALQGFGLFALPSLMVLVTLVWIGLFYFVPLVVNPFHVLGRLEERSLAPGTLTMFAVVGVVAMNLVFLLMIALSAGGMLIASRERRYLRMIDKLRRGPDAKVAVPPTSQH